MKYRTLYLPYDRLARHLENMASTAQHYAAETWPRPLQRRLEALRRAAVEASKAAHRETKKRR